VKGECGARLALGESAWASCTLLTVNHKGHDHRSADGHEWPACSQHCLIDHAHGAYRRHLGQDLGPKSAVARLPKAASASRSRTQCRICLEVAELRHGICADRETCEQRMAPLF
jgi:hypothetical protein